METLWKKLSQFALAAIVVLLAVVFALQFGGPQAQGCGSCSKGSSSASSSRARPRKQASRSTTKR
jgi:hypothetical protein